MSNTEAKSKALKSLLAMVSEEISKRFKSGKKGDPKEIEIEITSAEPIQGKYLKDLRKKIGG